MKCPGGFLRMRRSLVVIVSVLSILLLVPVTGAAGQEAPPEKARAPQDPGDPSGRKDTRDHRPSQAELDELAQTAREKGTVRVIVELPARFVPEGALSEEEAAQQRAAIARERAALNKDLQGSGHREARAFSSVPYVAMELPEQAVERLRDSDHAAGVQVDEAVPVTLAESSPLVQATNMWDAGHTGSGLTVAVLDTGTDKAHSFFGNRVVEEACYSTTDATYSATTLCPNGQQSQTGSGAGVNCTMTLPGCDHGTHVAGIAAGSSASFSGVGKAANIMAVQVFSRFDSDTYCGTGGSPCVLTFTSDQIAGLERVYALRTTRTFTSVNMSLGGGKFTSHCDSDSRKAIIDNLASVNIATVIATGNDGYTDGVGAPACISSAIAVGSTTKSDTVSSFSNGHPTLVDVLAPGSSINSSVPGGGFSSFNGTSMATPQVAGAWALMRSHTPSASVATVLNALKSTGLPVTDSRGTTSFSHPRIRVYQAAFGSAPPGPDGDDFAAAHTVSAVPYTHAQSTVGATNQPGEPVASCTVSAPGKSIWFAYTPSANGPVTADTIGSNFDTVLVAYTGGSLGTLTEVACDDDSGGSLTSQVGFNGVAGTTYYLQASGYAGAAGSLVFNLDGPPPASTATAPAAPTGVSAAATGPTSARVTFTPGDDGGSPITSFQAQCVSSTGTNRTKTGAASPLDVSNLTTGATYRCRVRATNAVGTGPYSAYSNPFVPGSSGAVADFTGDGSTDFSFYRPSNARWYVNGISGSTAFGGVSGDVPVPADYSGDGTTDFAIYRPGTGRWYIHGVSGSTRFGGVAGDVPVPGDYDGDGTTEFGIYRPGTGRWYVHGVSGSTRFGIAGDVPVPGDYTGDGVTEFALYRPGSGRWYVHGVAGSTGLGGVAGDVPVPGDHTGDGVTDFAIYRPGSGRWYVHGVSGWTGFGGVTGDVPVPGDYDADGTTDFAIYRPGSGRWYVHGASGPTTFGGLSGDRPLPLPHSIYKPYFGAP